MNVEADNSQAKSEIADSSRSNSHRADHTNRDAADSSPHNSPRAGVSVEVGLVLGAGGSAADAWHAGVTYALQEETAWDSRQAALIVGTSAGAISGLALRAGIPPSDLYAAQTGLDISEAGQQIFDRVVTPYSEGQADRSGGMWGLDLTPQSPMMTARSLWPPWQVRPVHAAVGLLPEGIATTEALGQRLQEMHPDRWPAQRLWVTAVRLDDGRRVVFGRDDVNTTVPEAIRASCAVPLRYEPVTIGGHRYIDGGLHSATNADLVGPPAFDIAVISSVMSGDAGWSGVLDGLRTAWSSVRNGISAPQQQPTPDLKNAPDTPNAKDARDTKTAGSSAPDDQPTAGSSAPDDQPTAGSSAPDDQPAWWCNAWSQAWSDGKAIKATRRQWLSGKLKDEVDSVRRRNTLVLLVEPDADTVDLLDSDNPLNHRTDDNRDNRRGDNRDNRRRDNRRQDWQAEIAARAAAATRRQLRTDNGARITALLRNGTP